MIGRQIGHYKIVEKIGEGGMGVVFRAHDEKLARDVALKFLPLHLVGDDAQRERFIQEAKAVSSLDHPNVCTVYDINMTESGQMYICMAFYEGATLKNIVKEGPIPLTKMLYYAVQIARGLSRAHEANVVHRDVKPANVVVTTRDEIKILDFGVAKLARGTGITKTGTTMGTIGYMSPEQARGEKVDHRADIWSLGVMMYEMLAGERPFRGEFDQAVIYSILNEDPPRLNRVISDLPKRVADVVGRALEKDPRKRFQSMEALLVELEALKYEIAGESPISGTQTRVIPRRRSGRLWVAGIVGAVSVIAALAAYSFWPRQPSAVAREKAIAAREMTKAAERDALVSGVEESSSQVTAADDLMARAQAEFDAGRYEQAATLFVRATSHFREAKSAAKREKVATTQTGEAATTPTDNRPPPTVKPPPREKEAAEPQARKAAIPSRDWSGDIARAEEGIGRAKMMADDAFAGSLASDTYGEAVKRQQEASRLIEQEDFEQALDRLSEARRLYASAADEANQRSKVATEEARSLQARVESLRASLDADFEFLPEYSEALEAERAAKSVMENHHPVAAVQKYNEALQHFEAARVSRARQESDIKALVDRYSRALEGENLDNMARLHVDFTPRMKSDWGSFFDAVSDLKVDISLKRITFKESGALAELSVRLRYSGARGSGDVHHWELDLRETEGAWLISDVHRHS